MPYDEQAKGPNANKEYWDARAEFTQMLNSALDTETIRGFNFEETKQFIGWLSTYRPQQPHAILTTLAVAFESK